MINARADKKAIRHQRQVDKEAKAARRRVSRHKDRDYIYDKVRDTFPANGPVVVETVENASSFGGQLDAVESLHEAVADADFDMESFIGGSVFVTLIGGGLLSLFVWAFTGYDYSIPVSVGIVWVIGIIVFLFARRAPYTWLRDAVRQANSQRPLHPVELEYLERHTKELERG